MSKNSFEQLEEEEGFQPTDPALFDEVKHGIQQEVGAARMIAGLIGNILSRFVDFVVLLLGGKKDQEQD